MGIYWTLLRSSGGMARKRTIDPDIWTDEMVQSLPSTTAVLFYIGTISQADDEGRLEWNARQLCGRIFPLRDDVKHRDVEVAMAAIVEAELIQVYEVRGKTYAAHGNWKKHQYVSKPTKSKLPEPPRGDSDSSPVAAPVLPESPRGDSGSLHVPLVTVSGTVTDTGTGPAREAEPDRSELAPAMQFGQWFFTAGLDADVIPKHLAVVPGPLGFALEHRAASEVLVGAYDDVEIRRRALNLFARKKLAGEGRVHIAATPSLLAEHWEWFDTAEAPQRRHTRDLAGVNAGRTPRTVLS